MFHVLMEHESDNQKRNRCAEENGLKDRQQWDCGKLQIQNKTPDSKHNYVPVRRNIRDERKEIIKN